MNSFLFRAFFIPLLILTSNITVASATNKNYPTLGEFHYGPVENMTTYRIGAIAPHGKEVYLGKIDHYLDKVEKDNIQFFLCKLSEKRRIYWEREDLIQTIDQLHKEISNGSLPQACKSVTKKHPLIDFRIIQPKIVDLLRQNLIKLNEIKSLDSSISINKIGLFNMSLGGYPLFQLHGNMSDSSQKEGFAQYINAISVIDIAVDLRKE